MRHLSKGPYRLPRYLGTWYLPRVPGRGVVLLAICGCSGKSLFEAWRIVPRLTDASLSLVPLPSRASHLVYLSCVLFDAAYLYTVKHGAWTF